MVFHSVTVRGARFDEINGADLLRKRGWTPLVVCTLRNSNPAGMEAQAKVGTMPAF